MKTNDQNRSRSFKHSALGMLGLTLALNLAHTASAAVWSYTNRNDTAWATAKNWTPNTVPPLGTTNYPGRFNIAAAGASSGIAKLVYDSPLSTGFGTWQTGVAPEYGRALSVGNGTGTTGTLEVISGTLVAFQAKLDDAVIVCAAGDGNTTAKGYLTLNGGSITVIATNYGVLSFPFRGSSNSLGVVTVQNGSTLKVDRLRFGGTGAGGGIGAGLPGIFNLNSGGTVNVRNIGNLSNPTNLRATNNFNGGTIKVLAAESAGEGRNPLIGSNIVNNILAGGLVVDTAGFDGRIVSPLLNGTAGVDGGVTKNGIGTLNLRGVGSTYVGATVVNQGTLGVQVPMTGNDFRVQPGAGLNFIHDNTAPWSLPALNLTNANLGFDYGNYSGYTAAVVAVSTLNLQGTIRVNLVGTSFPVTNLTLLTYGSKTGGGSFTLGSLPAGATASLVDTGSSLELHITAPSIQNLVWSYGDGIWQTGGGLDWNGGTATYLEYAFGGGDIVNFDDTMGGTVTIGSVVKPASVAVNTASAAYVFSGAGSISGPTEIEKTGAATLQIDTSNDYTGLTSVEGGVLYVNNAKALGSTVEGTVVSDIASSLAIGAPGGNGIKVTGETATIGGTGFGGVYGALRGAATVSGSNVWDGPVIFTANPTRIGTEDGGNLTVAGSITDRNYNYSLLFRPGYMGSIVVSGVSNNWGGTSDIFGTDANSKVILGVSNGFPTNSLLTVANATLDLKGFHQTSAGIALGGGTTAVAANSIVDNTSAAVTLTLMPAAAQTFAGVIQGNIAIVKAGTNSQTLSGPRTYTGATTVNGGTLIMAPDPNFTPMPTTVTVTSGGTLGGEGTISGSLSLSSGAGLLVDPATPESFTASTITAPVSGQVNVSFASAFPAGDVLVLTASTPGGITASASAFRAVGTRGGTFYLDASNTQLFFTPSTVVATLTWKGNNSVNPTFWDVNTTTNWDNAGSPNPFMTGDSVVFNDTATTFDVAIQSGTVSPTSVTFNSASNYTVSGGAIVGTTGLAKNGSGIVTLASANSYDGTTTITAGTVVVQNNSALGSKVGGTTVSAGATLDLGGTMANETLNLGTEMLTVAGTGVGGNGAVVNNSANSQYNAVQQMVLTGDTTFGGMSRWDLRGTGNALDMGGFTLTKIGTNQVSLVGTEASANPGNIKVLGGIFGVQLAVNMAGSSANTLTVASNATFNNYQVASPMSWSLVLSNGSTYWSQSGSGLQNDWAGPVALLGEATLLADGALTISGDVSGAGSFTKTGASTATLSGNNTYTGGTTITNGVLVMANSTALGTGPVTMNRSAIRLVVNDDLTLTNNIIINGGGVAYRGLIENSGAGNATLSGGTITINNNLLGGGHFGSATGGTLTIADPIFSTTNVSSRIGTVIFKGGGSYSNFLQNAGTVRLGANNGLSTSASVELAVSAAGVLDLAGFNQTLAGLKRTTANAASVTNSSSTADSVLTVTGTSSYPGLIEDSGVAGNRIALVVSGGDLTLSGSNSYSGGTVVSAGALRVNNTEGSGTGTGAVAVQSGATLAGQGILAGDVTVSAGATLAPGGAGVGTLTLNGSLSLAGNASVKTDKSLVQSNDFVNVLGVFNHSGAGTLTVSNLGPALVTGDTFKLFSQPVPNGNLLTVVGPAGVTFTNHLATDGGITVLVAAPPTLHYINTGTALEFSWTGNFKLQAQTNALSVGISSNWVDYPGGNSSPVSVPLDATQGSVFFRLVSP